MPLSYGLVTGVGQRRKSRSARTGRECTREKFEETSQRPVRWLLSTCRYRATMRDEKYEEGRPRSLATVADDSSSGMARSVTRVQLGASQRSWHGALFRLGETRFEEGRGNGRGKRHRRLNLKYLERSHLPYGPSSGKTHFRSLR